MAWAGRQAHSYHPRMPGPETPMPAVDVGGRRVEWSPQASVAVGRDPAGDVVVDGPRVSRRHVLVEAVPGGWMVRDAASRNGTFLNGERISEIQVTGDLTLALGSATEGSPLQIALVPVAPPRSRPGPAGRSRPDTAAARQAASPAGPAGWPGTSLVGDRAPRRRYPARRRARAGRRAEVGAWAIAGSPPAVGRPVPHRPRGR